MRFAVNIDARHTFAPSAITALIGVKCNTMSHQIPGEVHYIVSNLYGATREGKTLLHQQCAPYTSKIYTRYLVQKKLPNILRLIVCGAPITTLFFITQLWIVVVYNRYRYCRLVALLTRVAGPEVSDSQIGTTLHITIYQVPRSCCVPGIQG